MKIIALNYTKIAATKLKSFLKAQIKTDIRFNDLKKQESTQVKDGDLAVLSFAYNLVYDNLDKKDEKLADILFEGDLVVMFTSEEAKEVWKSWKKKELSDEIRTVLINAIIRRCTTKALILQEDLRLPHHIPFPSASLNKKQ